MVAQAVADKIAEARQSLRGEAVQEALNEVSTPPAPLTA
jgi:hypothetical protein